MTREQRPKVLAYHNVGNGNEVPGCTLESCLGDGPTRITVDGVTVWERPLPKQRMHSAEIELSGGRYEFVEETDADWDIYRRVYGPTHYLVHVPARYE